MYADIYDDAMWLINLVENLLSVSRIEEGRMNLRLSTELMDEVVSEALRHVNRRKTEYHLSVRSSEEYLLVQIDARLIVQVLINMIDNAIKYTPPGSEIIIELKRKGKFVYVSVADNGPGIPDEAKPHVFDMFYSASIGWRTAAGVWGWGWHCANPLSMRITERLPLRPMNRTERFLHFRYQPGR